MKTASAGLLTSSLAETWGSHMAHSPSKPGAAVAMPVFISFLILTPTKPAGEGDSG
jgi:hypothetical protein